MVRPYPLPVVALPCHHPDRPIETPLFCTSIGPRSASSLNAHAKSLPRPPPSRSPSPTNLVTSTSTPSPLNPCNRTIAIAVAFYSSEPAAARRRPRRRVLLLRAGGLQTPPTSGTDVILVFHPLVVAAADVIRQFPLPGSAGSGWSIGEQAGADGRGGHPLVDAAAGSWCSGHEGRRGRWTRRRRRGPGLLLRDAEEDEVI